MAQEEKKQNRTLTLKSNGAEIEVAVDENGNIIMPPEVEQLIAMGLDVAKKAKQANEPPVSGNTQPQKLGDAAGAFKGLPMRELIGGPLFAAAEAQQRLASIAWDYYRRIGFYQKGELGPDGKEVTAGATRLLSFDLSRPVEQNGKMEVLKQKVEAPFIGLVPIPSLLIDRVDVDFQMEVTDTNTTTDSTKTDVSTDISAKWFTVSASVSGKVSTSRENTRTTNQTAKYQVHVAASQQKPTEGLSKLMDVMASCIEPIPADTQQTPTGK